MVILYLFDPRNGYRYRHFSLDYYYRVKDLILSVQIVTATFVGVEG